MQERVLLDRFCPLLGQCEQLQDSQYREDQRGPGRSGPEIEHGQGQSCQWSHQDAGLIEDVEGRECVNPALAGVGGQVCAYRRVEQRTGETGCGGGDQDGRQRLGNDEQRESAGA